MLAEHAFHIHTVIDLITTGWLVWLLYKTDALEERVTKLGG